MTAYWAVKRAHFDTEGNRDAEREITDKLNYNPQ